MGKQTINGDVEITGQLLKGDLKALYHLGAYDSVDTSNADYDVITRGTGHATTFRELAKQIGGTTYGDGVPSWASTRQSINTTMFANGGITSIYPVMSNDSAWGYSGNSNIVIGYSSDRISVYGKSPLTGAILLDTLIEIEYQLSSPYTEKHIKNQPLSTLDQNGENWLRGMYEKTLNLWDSGDVVASTGGAHSWQNKRVIKTLPAGTYTIVSTHSGSVGYIGIGIGSTSYVSEGGSDSPHSFTLSQTSEVWFDWYASLSTSIDNTTIYSNIMLNSGSTAKPFVDYNGKVMHAIDVEGVKLWENGNPNTSFSPNAVSLPTLPEYSRILFAFKLNNDGSYATQSLLVFKEVGKYAFLACVGSGGDTWERTAFIETSTTIRFMVGKHSGNDDNYALIPVAIYGIK